MKKIITYAVRLSFLIIICFFIYYGTHPFFKPTSDFDASFIKKAEVVINGQLYTFTDEDLDIIKSCLEGSNYQKGDNRAWLGEREFFFESLTLFWDSKNGLYLIPHGNDLGLWGPYACNNELLFPHLQFLLSADMYNLSKFFEDKTGEEVVLNYRRSEGLFTTDKITIYYDSLNEEKSIDITDSKTITDIEDTLRKIYRYSREKPISEEPCGIFVDFNNGIVIGVQTENSNEIFNIEKNKDDMVNSIKFYNRIYLYDYFSEIIEEFR